MIEKVTARYWDVADTTYDELLAEIDGWVTARQGTRLVCFCDGNGMPKAYFGDEELRQTYAAADAVCPDGVSVKYLAKVCGGVMPRSVMGPELFVRALEYGVSRGWRHFFYGTNKDTLDTLKVKMEARFPGVKIVGTCAPEYSHDPRPPTGAACDILWVALGCPKQEKWCARHLRELEAAVVLPVGAAFDFHAGTASKAPNWVTRAGLCWLWRMATGGRRVLWRNLKCVSLALVALGLEAARRTGSAWQVGCR